MWWNNSVATLQQLYESSEWGSTRSGMKYPRIPWSDYMTEWPASRRCLNENNKISNQILNVQKIILFKDKLKNN